MEEVKASVKEFQAEAVEYLKDDEKVEGFLQSVEAKLAKIPRVGGALKDVPVMLSLMRAYVMKQYKNLPTSTAVAIMAALIYFVTPFDLISDLIPVVGLLDDAAAMAFVVSMVHDDLNEYTEWQKENGKRQAE